MSNQNNSVIIDWIMMTYEELPDISENSQELPLEFSPHDWSSFVKVVPFINL